MAIISKFKSVLAVALSAALCSLVTGNAGENAHPAPEATAAKSREGKPYAMPRTEVVPLKDSNAGRQYELYIKLPEDYSKNTDVEYPVIYATDGIWHMDMLSGATEYLMSNVILVGISWQKDLGAEEEFTSRFRDYTVIEFRDPKIQTQYQGGQAGNHLSFIRNNVIDYVEHNYRANPDERTYFGYSLGGVLGAYILLAQPDTFSNYILGSPALGARSVEYIDELEVQTAHKQQGLSTNVFVSIGELEEANMEITKEFISVLQRRSEAGLTLTGLEIIENSDHTTAFPATTIQGVKWVSRLSAE